MDVRLNEQLVEEAARWCARLAAPDCTEHDRANFAMWRLRDASHARAFAEAENLFGRLPEMAAADSRLREMADRAYAQGGSKVSAWRRAVLPVGLAASIALALIGIRSTLHVPHIPKASMQPTAYTTAAAERRSVTLADGSIVHLDIASRIEVLMADDKREIRLFDGRALFEVAHDASRPFSVFVNGGRVVALGTKFQVERDDSHVIVTLTEGSVAVDDSSAAVHRHDTLLPGEQLSFGVDTLAWTKRTVDSQLATSWSRGRHIFRGTPLDEALEEVNRYAGRKVRLGDPSLAELRVGGNFVMGDSERVVAAFAAVLPVRAVEGSGNEIVLLPSY